MIAKLCSPRQASLLLTTATLAFAVPAAALEFGSSSRVAILYDAPAASAQKVSIVSAGYPLEKIITTRDWIKVRDDSGALLWIEAAALAGKPSLLVTAALAQVHETPADTAAVRFNVRRGVILEPIAKASSGWIKIRHASGQEGYTRVRHLWGL